MPPIFTCPKCNHEQTNQVECESCGLIFRKYAQAQERSRLQAQEAALDSQENGARPRILPRLIVSAIALIVLTAGATFYLMKNRPPQATAPPPSASAPPSTQPVLQQPAEHSSQMAQQTRTPAHVMTTFVPGSPLEQAKQGTVAIETPWGQGSGFFITDTTIVTNKHVIQANEDQLQEIRHKVETGRRLIDLEQEKLGRYRRQLPRINDGPSRQQLRIIIQEMERQLAEVVPKQEEVETRLRKMEQPTGISDIKLFLADGTEFTANSTQTSSTRDLALLTVFTSKAMVLPAALGNTHLNQGDRVFTIGNPVGLRNTVTAGVFSGYRQHKETGEVLLQTDAPINPGNSGGPLIDELGRVHGINTMIIRNTQGIGFAIPIREVFEEFSLTPPQNR